MYIAFCSTLYLFILPKDMPMAFLLLGGPKSPHKKTKRFKT